MKFIPLAAILFLITFVSPAFADAAFTLDEHHQIQSSDPLSAIDQLAYTLEDDGVDFSTTDLLPDGFVYISTVQNGIVTPAIKFNSNAIYIVGNPNFLKLQIAICTMVAIGLEPLSISGDKGFRAAARLVMTSYNINPSNLR